MNPNVRVPKQATTFIEYAENSAFGFTVETSVRTEGCEMSEMHTESLNVMWSCLETGGVRLGTTGV
jgi:hypothetical protein